MGQDLVCPVSIMFILTVQSVLGLLSVGDKVVDFLWYVLDMCLLCWSAGSNDTLIVLF